MKFALFLAIAVTVLAAGTLVGQDTTYPIGHSIDSRYWVSDTLVALGDTITIERRLRNNETFSLSGVYLTENLPGVFDIVEQTVTIDGTPVAALTEGPEPGGVINGYDTYRWTIDSPDPSEGISRSLEPGEELLVRYRVVSSDIGNFGLPLHLTAMYGNGAGIFATGTGDTVHVIIALDVEDPDDGAGLPREFKLVTAYPNPFNAAVSIAWEGPGLVADLVQLDIYNVAGRLVTSRSVRAESDRGLIGWEPDGSTGSGLYFFRLSAGGATATGKLVLVK